MKNILTESNFKLESNSDEEILVKLFILYGYDIVNYLDGVFTIAIWDTKKEELFLARDHLGVKPLYYYMENHVLYFSVSIKNLFQEFNLRPILNAQSIGEIFGIGPAHTPGLGIFKDVFELKPAHIAVFNKNSIHFNKYWKLESNMHEDDLDTTCDRVSHLLESAINKQLGDDKNICTMLSGGLDSSIMTAYAYKHVVKNNCYPLKTFSVDYLDNDKNFIKSEFQPNSDNYYIDIMRNIYKTHHRKFIIDTPELAKALKEAMLLRGYPGMADVDSSLLLFCKEIKKECHITFSGECADEVFGGYPWFFNENSLESNTFPWSLATLERQNILNPEISKKLDLKEYIDYRYNESLSEVNVLNCDSKDTKRARKASHLTFNWFMQTLLDRADRMSNGLEIRVPFCDYKLIEYVWNIPWEMKALNGREKGLLRYIMEKKKVLPREIIERKKSPYPKTHNPTYLKVVKNMLLEIMKNQSSPIHNLINDDYVFDILNTDGKNFSKPWFGQLMTGPQLIAYLIQLNMWLEEFNPKFEL